MASSKLHLLHVLPFGKLSLPTLSLALLTGFTFSIILPSSLHPLFPAMESLFLVSLPHLWRASLSWFTPTCLFLLLNGIIMILTATSGSLSAPPPSQSPTNFLAKMEKFTSNVDVASIEPPPATTSPIEPNSVDAAPAGFDLSSPPTLRLEGPIVSFSNIPVCYHCLHAQDAAMEEVELPKDVNCHDDFHDVNSRDDDDDDDDDDADENMEEMQIISQEELQQTVAIVDMPKIDGSDDLGEVPKAGSEPSTPKHSSAAMKDNMRRSLSIDSVPYIDNIEESPEYKLSEEAFKKRIEDYIFKVNAKLRSETRLT